MGSNNSTISRELLDEVARISASGETGRLQIVSGTTKGAFFFNRGKLVDARMGPFSGFPAVNLAVSMGASGVGFDSAVQPRASIFDRLSERIVLKERFGIDAGDEELVNDAVTIVVDETIGKVEEDKNDSAAIFASHAPPEAISFSQKTRSRILVRTAAIVLIVGSAVVGLASFWSPEPSSVPISNDQASPSVTEVSAPNANEAAPEKATDPLPNNETGPAAPPLPNNERPILKHESRQKEQQPSDVRSTSDSEFEVDAPGEKQISKPSSRAIAVVLEVQNGRVTEAYVQNRQPGFEAFEATALRLARQRRYPNETQGKQTLVLTVTSEP